MRTKAAFFPQLESLCCDGSGDIIDAQLCTLIMERAPFEMVTTPRLLSRLLAHAISSPSKEFAHSPEALIAGLACARRFDDAANCALTYAAVPRVLRTHDAAMPMLRHFLLVRSRSTSGDGGRLLNSALSEMSLRG